MLSTCAESGSSFRVTQLLLPAEHDASTPARPRQASLHVTSAAPPPDNDDLRRLDESYRQTSWQTSIKFDKNECQQLSQHHCSVLLNTDGQMRNFCKLNNDNNVITIHCNRSILCVSIHVCLHSTGCPKISHKLLSIRQILTDFQNYLPTLSVKYM